MKNVDLDSVQYQPIWKCIYCGWDHEPEKLSGEHILTLGFGGKAVLPRSSCPDCCNATSDFERYCSHDIFGPLRILYGYPTRHPEKRPKTLPLDVTVNGITERRQVRIDDYPAATMTIGSWGPPGLLIGLPRIADFHGLRAHVINPSLKDQAGRLERLGIFQGARITMPLVFNAVPFSRFIAKFAHAMAVAEWGLDSFKPYLTDLIRGLDDCPAHLIGGATSPFESGGYPGKKDHHFQIDLVEMKDRQCLCARIRFFGFLGLPTYAAVIGEPSPALVQRLKTSPQSLED